MNSQVAGRVPGVPIVLTGFLVLVGIAIAWMDTRPRWDDAGVTAGALLVAATFGGVLGVRPWLAAILVVAPLLIAELASAGVGLFVAPVIAFAGAYGGAVGRYAVTGSTK